MELSNAVNQRPKVTTNGLAEEIRYPEPRTVTSPVHVAKRGIDIAVSFVGLCTTLPFYPLIMAAIAVDSPGPIFYKQKRAGRLIGSSGHGRDLKFEEFWMVKFRTMKVNAELKTGAVLANEHDPRISRVGRFLRKTRLDELPQFLNVLKGEMSIVGPRPAEDGMDTYRLWYGERLEVPPGITGIWQLEGRAAISFDERLRYDLEYIRTMSLWLDVRLIVRTIAVVFKGTGV
jgi:lipopolysaccharide/colanic/teichoic acid biosynthesis glycosyltransferase